MFTTVNIILFSVGFALVLVGQYLDALVSVGVISFNLVISLIQEIRAKGTLDRIALLTRPKATVVRDGREQQLDPGEIVVDDILVLHPGDQIVVDGPIISDGRVEVDESLLTGESELVVKREGDSLFSGTYCVAGQACYRAEKVGVQSVAGILTVGARAFRKMYTPLQRDINLIIRVLLLVAILLEVLLIASSLVSIIPVVETVRMAMVIISIVPNGLFLSISVAYALGSVRMAGKGVLAQKFNAIESMSHIDVLCTDKTGTLTANALAVESLHPYGMKEAAFRGALGSYITRRRAAMLPVQRYAQRVLTRDSPYSPPEKRSLFHRSESGARWSSMKNRCEASTCWARQRCSSHTYLLIRTWEPSSKNRQREACVFYFLPGILSRPSSNREKVRHSCLTGSYPLAR